MFILSAGIAFLFIGLILVKLILLKRRIITALFIFVSLFLGVVFTYVGYNIMGYGVFDKGKPLALVECQPVKGELYDMVLELRQLQKSSVSSKEKFLLSGTQWAIGANVITIKPVFSVKEVNLYRLTLIKSRHFNPYSPGQSSQIDYALCPAKNTLVDFFSKRNYSFIKAGSFFSEYILPSAGSNFYLYYSGAGLVIKKEKIQ